MPHLRLVAARKTTTVCCPVFPIRRRVVVLMDYPFKCGIGHVWPRSPVAAGVSVVVEAVISHLFHPPFLPGRLALKENDYLLMTEIAIMIAVPCMVVLNAAVGTVPVTVVEVSSIVPRPDPSCTYVRRTSPIPVMPDISAAYGIPISAYPRKTWTRARWYGDNAWRRGCTDGYSN